MGSYRLVVKPSVEKDLRSLPKESIARVFARIEELRTDPLPRGAIKLSGAERLYRVRVGDYRIVYELDADAEQVTVLYVRHRRDAYRRL